MTPFQPLFELESKLLVFLLFFWAGGTALLAGLPDIRKGEKHERWWFGPLGIAAGFLAFQFFSFVSLRLSHIAGLNAGAGTTFAMTAVIFAAILWLIYRVPENRSRLREFLPAVRTGWIGIAGCLAICWAAGNLVLLPLWLDSGVQYFSGYGTDALGYIRMAMAHSDGWYTRTMPQLSPEELLRHPSRTWPLAVMANYERPGLYIFLALTAWLLRVNEFQAYLLAGATLPAALTAALGFLGAQFNLRGRFGALLPAAAILIVPASAIVGNFFHQFFGQAFAVTLLLMLPAAFYVLERGALGLRLRMVLAGAGIGVLQTFSYDYRYALVALAAGLPAALLIAKRSERETGPILQAATQYSVAGVAAVAAFCGKLGVHQTFPKMSETPFSVQSFAAEAAFFDGGALASLLIALAVLAGLAAGFNLDRIAALTNGEQMRPAVAFTASLAALNVVLLIAMLLLKNDWAAAKTLYVALPAGLMLILFLSGRLLQRSSNRAGKFSGICLAVLLCTIGVFSALATWRQAEDIVRSNAGTLRRDGILKLLSEIEEKKPQAVYLQTGDVTKYLTVITLLDRYSLPVYSPFALWRSGPGVQYFSATAAEAQSQYDSIPKAGTDWRILHIKDGEHQLSYEVVTGGLEGLKKNYTAEVIFPARQSGSEPILVCGTTGRAFLLIARYIPESRLQLGIDVWGQPLDLSEPIAYTPGTPVKVTMTIRIMEDTADVLWNDRIVLGHRGGFAPAATAKPVFGENRIGATTSGRQFTGSLTPSPGA